MKNRYFTGTLILFVLLVCGILFKADSQIQPAPLKFKVAVSVDCKVNPAHQSLIEGIIKRELRSFEDVQIVGDNLYNGLWEYMISVNLMGIKTSDGKIYQYAICREFYKKVPIEHFDPHWRRFYSGYPAITIPSNTIGNFGINKLEIMAKSTAADFDKILLQPIRDIHIRYP